MSLTFIGLLTFSDCMHSDLVYQTLNILLSVLLGGGGLWTTKVKTQPSYGNNIFCHSHDSRHVIFQKNKALHSHYVYSISRIEVQIYQLNDV